MCLIFAAWRHHPDYRLVVAANRDETLDRPTAPAQLWEDAPWVVAGRDLRAGGTWLGVAREGRFSALTSHRGREPFAADAPSRGHLVGDFLRAADSPSARAYVQSLTARADDYNGFNLLAADENELVWYSNRAAEPRTLAPGVYGLSNDLLDTPWPKVVRGKAAFAHHLERGPLDVEALFDLLADRTTAADPDLPDTGIGLDRERALSPLFIRTTDYGTRSSTIVLIDHHGGITLHERTHPTRGTEGTETVTLTFPVEPNREAI